jgi:hypothetical protein
VTKSSGLVLALWFCCLVVSSNVAVYEAIYEEARKSPLNGKHMVGWDKFSEVLDLDFIKDKQGQRHVPQAKM